MEHDSRAFLLALMAMNMRLITDLAAKTGSVDAARNQMDEFEAVILQYINKMQVSLKPGESQDDLVRLRGDAGKLVSEWMASFRFT